MTDLMDPTARYGREVARSPSLPLPEGTDRAIQGFYDPRTRQIYVDSKLNIPLALATLGHEQGHAAAHDYARGITDRLRSGAATPDDWQFARIYSDENGEERRQRMLDASVGRTITDPWRWINWDTARGFDPTVDTEMRAARAHKQEQSNDANRILLDHVRRASHLLGLR